jgi:lysophospholipase L1-like esterase
MNYLALGDSISIDDYTGVAGGGAVSQFARMVGVTEVQDLTFDGCTTAGVLEALRRVTIRPHVVTLTVGGNDFLERTFEVAMRKPEPDWLGDVAEPPIANLERIGERLAEFRCPVILNAIYDPTDGDDSLALEFGMPVESRIAYDAINERIRELARERGFLLSDLQRLCRGHGVRSDETWFTLQIEPNLSGATAIARHWEELFVTRNS